MNLEGKKVLVTGADGFIGSHLVEELVNRGVSVKAFVYYNSFNSWGWLDTIEKRILNEMEIFAGDVRDPHCVREAIRDCNLVFHLAALIAIPYSYKAPASYIDTNVKGTLNIVQAARDYGIDKVIHTSSSEVYGTAQYIPIDEAHPLQSQSPYAASKIGADQIALSFYRSFGTPVTILRPFNNYGPRQSLRAVIPTIITQMISGKKKLKLGSIYPTRDFMFVKDTASAFIHAAESDHTTGSVFNVGTGREISVEQIANKIAGLIGTAAAIISENERVRPANSEVERLLADSTRFRDITDWVPRYDLEAGLVETIEWYKATGNLSNLKTEIYNI